MNVAIIQLTARQMLGQKRSLLLFATALIPVLIAVVYRFSDATNNTIYLHETGVLISAQPRWVSRVLLSQLIVGTLLPLAALIFGTAAIGSEIEDGTAVYLLSKPIPRWRIVASKMLVAWATTSALVLSATVISVLIALEHPLDYGILIGFLLAGTAGALVYTALFVLLSIVTSRALIVGLLYVFIWEAVLTRLFNGLRYASVREYALGVADRVITAPAAVFSADLEGNVAVILVFATSALLSFYAARRLAVWEIGEST
ncbi:MAG: ABC transporter permease subunit [Anaerolineaceae bacterium]